MTQTIRPMTKEQALSYLREKSRVYFVAIDGEAIEGKYCLLGSSENTSAFNPSGLTPDEIFDFLFEIHSSLKSDKRKIKRKIVYVFFAGHYDVNMFFRSFTDDQKDVIFGDTDEWLKWGDYKIHYNPKKSLKISRTNPARPKHREMITVYDSFSFFNTSFGTATKNFYGEVPKIVQWGKKARVSFAEKDIAKMNKYNNAECEILVDMMNTIANWLEELGINTTSWHGPSALANRALKEMKINRDQMHYSEEGTPEAIWKAIIHSTFGGRFEALNLGSVFNCQNFDINSAYPAAMKNLPAITDIDQWVYTKKFLPQHPFGIYHVKWEVSPQERICPFPWRTKQGLILFPPIGEGWYHYPEVFAALEKHGSKQIQVLEGFYADAPLSRIGEVVSFLYTERQKLKAEGNPAEYILKILMNSFFGKFMQSVGRPQFQCLPWAGYITSYTRAKILTAVSGYECEIVAFAADGIFSRVDLPHLKIGKGLGEWSASDYEKVTVLMSGVYRKYKGQESDCTCQNEEMILKGIKCTVHVDATRGYRAASSLWDSILDSLNAGKTAEIFTNQFITYKMARNRVGEKRDEMYKFIQARKEVNPAHADKRKYFLSAIRDWRTDCCDSEPNYIPQGERGRLSHPYKLKSVAPFQTAEDEDGELVVSDDGEILPL